MKDPTRGKRVIRAKRYGFASGARTCGASAIEPWTRSAL